MHEAGFNSIVDVILYDAYCDLEIASALVKRRLRDIHRAEDRLAETVRWPFNIREAARLHLIDWISSQ